MSTNPTPPGPADRIEKAGKRWGGLAAALVAVAVLAFGVGAYTFGGHTLSTLQATEDASSSVQRGAEPFPVADTTRGAPPRMMENGAPFSFADLVEHVTPAVVTILVDKKETAQQYNVPDNLPPGLRDFFNQFGQGGNDQEQPRTFRSEAMGSGFIIDPNGYIVTNNHVIESADKISVKLPDKREFEAKLVGADPATDVALLKVDGVHDLPTVAFGDDRKLRVGDWVVAVGNPFGLGGTVTAGIVSSIGRDIGAGPYTDYIQIDAPINRGNSGGPTFDLTGRVVGMNSAIFSPTGGSVGIGFAIPASTVQQIVGQLKEKGSVTRGWLGVEIQSLTPDLAKSMGIDNAKGALVARVIGGSPAATAGFVQGDVVVALDGKDVDDSRDLTRKVAALRVGEKASFIVLRDGKRQTLTATIAKRDEQQIASNEGQESQPSAAGDTTSSLGLQLSTLNDVNRNQYGIGNDVRGVLVAGVDPNSDAADKGLRAGDVILSLGTKSVSSPNDITQGVKAAQDAGRDSVALLVTGTNGQRFVSLKITKS